MYWPDPDGSTIKKADLDGNNQELLHTRINTPFEIAIDHNHGKFYWTDVDENKICRANLDGTRKEEIITTQVPQLLHRKRLS